MATEHKTVSSWFKSEFRTLQNKNKRFSLRGLASKIGIDQSRLSKVLQNKGTLTLPQLRKAYLFFKTPSADRQIIDALYQSEVNLKDDHVKYFRLSEDDVLKAGSYEANVIAASTSLAKRARVTKSTSELDAISDELIREIHTLTNYDKEMIRNILEIHAKHILLANQQNATDSKGKSVASQAPPILEPLSLKKQKHENMMKVLDHIRNSVDCRVGNKMDPSNRFTEDMHNSWVFPLSSRTLKALKKDVERMHETVVSRVSEKNNSDKPDRVVLFSVHISQILKKD